jgi:hypothetical protein
MDEDEWDHDFKEGQEIEVSSLENPKMFQHKYVCTGVGPNHVSCVRGDEVLYFILLFPDQNGHRYWWSLHYGHSVLDLR